MAERTTKPCRRWFGQRLDTTVGEHRLIPLRELRHQRYDETDEMMSLQALLEKSSDSDLPSSWNKMMSGPSSAPAT
jgi:hypothetical protein